MKPPTEEELRAHRNVPLYMAAAYLGIGKRTLTGALRTGLWDIGRATQSGKGGGWVYVIPPERLIRWYHGLETERPCNV